MGWSEYLRNCDLMVFLPHTDISLFTKIGPQKKEKKKEKKISSQQQFCG